MVFALVVGLIVFLAAFLLKRSFMLALQYGVVTFAVLGIIFFFADVSINGHVY